MLFRGGGRTMQCVLKGNSTVIAHSATAPVPQPPSVSTQPPMVTLRYVPTDPKAAPSEVGIAPDQLRPAKDWIKPVEPFVPAGTSMTVAMKIARARAGVAVDAQPQIVLKNAQDGALYVTGSTSVSGPKAGSVAAIDGASLAGVKSVTAQRLLADVQAVVGADGWIDLTKSDTGSVVPFTR